MKSYNKILIDKSLLLEKFNNRDRDAFGEVYKLFYKDIFNYTQYLYRETQIDSADIVNDLFLYLWQKKTIHFDELLKIKAYLFISVKNGFKNHLKHQKCESRFNSTLIEKNFKFDIIEFEMYSMLEEAMNLLPEECRKVFELYLDGLKPDEIAQRLGKKTQTIYNKKQEAIAIIRKKLSKDMFLFLKIV